MIVLQKSLPRTFLRGLGAAVALPLLDSMVPLRFHGHGGGSVRRLGFVYIPNGAIMDKWTPAVDGALELSPTLQPLAAFRDRLVVISNLASRPAEALEGSGDHARASAVWLSGVHPKRTEGADVQKDHRSDRGRHVVPRHPARSLSAEDFSNSVGTCDIGYACSYVNTLSWRTPTVPLPMQTNPRVVFERLFGEERSATERGRQLSEDQSILDAIVDQTKRLRSRVGAADSARVGDYLDSVREVERRVRAMEAQTLGNLVLPEVPTGVPDSYDQHVGLMYDLQVLAYQADVTRVSTFMLAREASTRTYNHIGVPDPHHAISHRLRRRQDGARAEDQRLPRGPLRLLPRPTGRRRPTARRNCSITLILYGGCISDGNLHSHSPLPTLLAGGAAGNLSGGRHLRYPENTPLANLLVAMLEKVEVGGRVGRQRASL